MNSDKILELEIKYNSIIQDFIFGETFISDLKNLESQIQFSYQELSKNFDSKEKASSALEKILSINLPNVLNTHSAFPLPICSDVALMNEEVVIWIDAKAYDRHGNAGDEESIQIGKNQITIPSKPKNSHQINALNGENFKFPGFEVIPMILPIAPQGIYKGKPILTFTVGLWSYDDTQSFKMLKLETSCLPNYKVYESFFNEEIHANVKGYGYLGNLYLNHPIYKPYLDNEIPQDLRLINYNSGVEIDKLELPNLRSRSNLALVDLNNLNPYLDRDDAYLIRKFVDGQWKVTPYPSSFRISKKQLTKKYTIDDIEYLNSWRLKEKEL